MRSRSFVDLRSIYVYKPALKPAAAGEGASEQKISPLAQFIPLNSSSACSSSTAPPAPVAAGSSSSALPGPYLQHGAVQQQLCQQHQARAPALSQGLPGNLETHPSVAETYEWLITSGVPFSAFDPIAIESSSRPSISAAPSPGHGNASAPSSDLFDCADEIKSLFSSVAPAAVVSSGPVLPPSLSCSSLQEAAVSIQCQQPQKLQAINQQWSNNKPETSISCDPLSLFGDPVLETESPLGLLGMKTLRTHIHTPSKTF